MLSLLVVAAGLSGCALPSQAHPSCVWDSSIPPHADTLCRQTFHTLAALTKAERDGDDRTVQRLVADPAVARRIIAYGRRLRHHGLQYLHVVPTPGLNYLGPNHLGARFDLRGETNVNIQAAEVVYVRIRHGVAVVVADQPLEEW